MVPVSNKENDESDIKSKGTNDRGHKASCWTKYVSDREPHLHVGDVSRGLYALYDKVAYEADNVTDEDFKQQGHDEQDVALRDAVGEGNNEPERYGKPNSKTDLYERRDGPGADYRGG